MWFTGSFNWPSIHLWMPGLFLLSGLQGCASYSQSFQNIETSLITQSPAAALQILEKQGHKKNNRLLFLLNKAILLRMKKDYAGSNKVLEEAKKIIQAYSAASVSEQSLAFLLNDSTITYTGSPLEQVMINVYAALNYLELGKLDDARVEILQADVRLRQLTEDAPKQALSVDPFARYLAGMVFEQLGEYSDAMIAYRKALQGYQLHNQELYPIRIPQQLKLDLLRMARKVGLDNEYEKLKQRFSFTDAQVDSSRYDTEIIFIFNNGLAPVKREESVSVVAPESGQFIRISLPYYQSRPRQVDYTRIIANDLVRQSELVENIDAIDRKTLETYMPKITARTITRAVIKYQMAREANKQNELAGLLVNIAGVLTERADTRSWMTLPTEIQLARLPVTAGKYDLRLQLLDSGHKLLKTIHLGKVDVAEGEKKFISYHYIPTSATGH